LEIDPTEWKDNIYYQFGKKVVDGLHIVNDTDERGVKLFHELFAKILDLQEIII